MKRNRIPALVLLLALLLALPARAGAGDADDPLISRSYAEDTFVPQAGEALSADAEAYLAAVRAGAAPGLGMTVLTLSAGDSVTLRDGQQLVLLSGGVRLNVVSGKLINCTFGRASSGGDARTGHRYVAWGGAEIVADCAESAAVAVSESAALRTAEPPDPACPFTDVPADAWYRAYVAGAYARGLVNGMTETTYAPDENMTLAQAVKLAACMRQLDQDGAVTLGNGDPWYQTYADYALAAGILETMPEEGWDDDVTRGGFVKLFFAALPEERYEPINEIPDGAIPDVPTDSPVAREVYAFYAAGILTGYAEGGGRRAHEFGAETYISRAEVAAILDRMFSADSRVSFEIISAN